MGGKKNYDKNHKKTNIFISQPKKYMRVLHWLEKNKTKLFFFSLLSYIIYK